MSLVVIACRSAVPMAFSAVADNPVMPPVDSASDLGGADVAAQGIDLGGGEHTESLSAQAREVRGGHG